MFRNRLFKFVSGKSGWESGRFQSILFILVALALILHYWLIIIVWLRSPPAVATIFGAMIMVVIGAGHHQYCISRNKRQRQVTRRLADELECFPQFVDILRGHLENINASTEAAAMDIMNALSNIRAQSVALLAVLKDQEEKAAEVTDAHVQRLDQIGQMLRDLGHYQEQHLAQIN